MGFKEHGMTKLDIPEEPFKILDMPGVKDDYFT